MVPRHPDIAANGGQVLDIPHPASSPAAPALNSSLRFCSPLKRHLFSSFLSPPLIGSRQAGSNGHGVVERAEELQRRGRAQPPGAVVPVVQPPAVLRQRHHLRPRHHVRRVDARPAPPCPPRRLLARGLRLRPSWPGDGAGELRAVQGVGGVPLPVGDAGGAGDPGAGGSRARQLGKGAGVGGRPRRPGDVPGQPGAVGVAADDPGDRVRGHRVRGAPAHHGERPREEEVPRRRLRPAGILQGPRQVRGVQAQGDQERPPRHARLRRLLRAAVGVPRHRPAGEPRDPPRRPVAQQHRRHHHPQINLPLSSSDACFVRV